MSVFQKILLRLLVVSLVTVHVSSLACTAKFKLSLQFINTTIHPNAACFDGSRPAFYIGRNNIEEVNVNRSFIIWLDDTRICSGESCDDVCSGTGRDSASGICEGVSLNNVFGSSSSIVNEQIVDFNRVNCIYSRITCTSDWWTDFDEVTPASILCQEQPFFGEFTRVFVPACTLDYWLGRGDDTNSSSPRHKGAINFDAMISTLVEEHGLGFAPRIVLGGTRGGGIGALNLLPRLRSLLNVGPNATVARNIMGVMDSSWMINFEEFAPSDEDRSSELGVFSIDNYLNVNSTNWINSSQIVQSCKNKWGPINKMHKCFYQSEIAKNHLPLLSPKERVMFIQSQYDLVHLINLGLADSDASEEFGDDVAFAQGTISYVENFGQEMRISLEEDSSFLQSENSFFYTTVCAQYGYIVPTQIHVISEQRQSVGDAGDILFKREEEIWENINSNQIVLSLALTTFVDSNGSRMLDTSPSTKFLGDDCGRFLCNDECPTKLEPFVVAGVLSPCLNVVVVVYSIFTLGVFLVAFLIAYFQLKSWNRSTKMYWRRIEIIENLEKMQFDNEFQEELKGELAKDGVGVQMKRMQYENNRTVQEVEEQLILESNTGEYREVHLMVENLSFWSPPKKRSLLGRSKYFKVLDNVNVGYQPGKVHAIMGPSGSGKSTLLDILSLTRDSGRMSGTHYINGVASNAKNGRFIKEWFKHNMSYVTQTDVLFPQLTVREHLEHAAWLMLPEYMPDDAKLRRVWQFLRLLDLSKAANTPCGDGGVTIQGGLSGGQRRRVSVATALLRNPCVIFLDEPTSGLDSYAALSLVERMHNLAEHTSVNVIMTIHQPRKEIFKFVDDVTILVDGRLCFFGSVDRAVNFFHLDARTANVGNDLIDILANMGGDARQKKIQEFKSSSEGMQLEQDMKIEKTSLTPETADQLREVLVFNSLAEGRWSWTSAGSVPWLQWVLISRTLKRGGFDIYFTMIYSLAGGLFLGSIFVGRATYRSRVALLYLTVACITFFQGVFLSNRYFSEKKMFDYEKKSGTMKSASAFLASQFTRDCAASSIETLVFIIPLQLLGGLRFDVEQLFNFLILCLLIGFATTCINVLIETQIDNVERASIAQVFILGIGALFNGFIINLSDLPVWLSWLPYLMLSFWGFVGVLVNELRAFSFPCDTDQFSVLECSVRTGDIIIRSLDYENFDAYASMAVLVLLIFIFRITAFFNFYIKYARTMNIDYVGEDVKGNMVTFSSSRSLLTRGPSDRSVPKGGELNTYGSFAGKTAQKVLGAKPSQLKEKLDSKKKPEDLKIAPKKFDLGEDENEDPLDDETEFSEEGDFRNESIVRKVLLSREFLTALFLIDVYVTGYTCLYSPELLFLFIAISGAFFALYAVQFVYQVWALIPYTIDGSGRDFVWASEYDFPALVTLIFDSCLFILQYTVSESFTVRLVLALTLKTIRGGRVTLYWLKVNKQHRVTANSFLEFKQQEMDQIIEKNLHETELGGKPGGRLSVRVSRKYTGQRTSQLGDRTSNRFAGVGRLSQKFNRENLKAALAQTRAARTDGEGAPPPRPPRPSARAIQASQAAPQRPPRPANSSSSGGPQRPPRPNESGSSGGPQRPAGPTARLSARLTGSINGPRRPARPSTYESVGQRRTDKAASGQGIQWKKFRNPTTGKTIYYNPFTGEVLEDKLPQVSGNAFSQPSLDEV